ncbi:MAG: heliorhodopsin HeR, partial [Candidatus Dadabacteria bacterium]|nr:heliorhodopsin HeR [Candidatus Dadabacteria bacterium]
MLALSTDFSLPVVRTYLEYEPGHGLVQVTDTLFSMQIAPLVALFLFISAAFHFMLATVMYDWYVRNLKRHINYARWYEYAFSSSVMIVVIALLVGMYDIGSLILLFSLNAIMNLCGLMMEKHNRTTKRTNWTSYIIGCFAGLMPWVVIAIY